MELKTFNKTETFNEEVLTQKLLSRKTTIQRFRLPMTVEQAQTFLKASYVAEVKFRNRTFIEDERINAHIERLATFLTDNNSKFGVMLCGTYGNGKTTLLYALRAVVSLLSDCGYIEHGSKLVVYDARELSKLYKDRDPETFNDACRERLLAIEDMGKEPTEELNYGSIISPVTELLEYRYNNQEFTVITTNLTPKEIREKYGNRIADRFNEMMCVLNFGAADTFRTR